MAFRTKKKALSGEIATREGLKLQSQVSLALFLRAWRERAGIALFRLAWWAGFPFPSRFLAGVIFYELLQQPVS